MDKLMEIYQSNPVLYGGLLGLVALLIFSRMLKSWLVFIVGAVLIGGAVLFGTQGGPESLDAVRQGATDQVKDSLQRARDVADEQDRRIKDQLGE